MNKLHLKDVLTTTATLRGKFLNVFKDDLWKPIHGLDLKGERDLALTRLKNVTNNKLLDVKDFKTSPKNIFDAHEYVGYMDGSTATKMTVQFNLFGGTVLNLGTEKHHGKFLDKINSLENIGCFAFTERAYGNNAFKMETTATYNESDNTFIINSPTLASHKYWITNSACHASHAVVFAQLKIKEKDYGPHPFLVKVREEGGDFLPNVTIKDMGYKIGLNGVDNGELSFNNFKTDADSLLNSVSDVEGNGEFHSLIDNKRKRFLKMADQLVSGRVCISSMMLGCSKVLLNNTINYALHRKSVGKSGDSTMPIIEYGIQRSTLCPLIVRTIGLNLGLNRTKEAYAHKDHDLITLACTIKPMLAWNTQEIVTQCRELTGGEGFLASNQFGEGIAASWAGMTAEGDSKVLLMKATSERIKNLDMSSITKTKIRRLFPSGVENNFKNRENFILTDLAVYTEQNKDYFGVWMDTHYQLVQDAAKAYCDKVVYDEFEKLIGIVSHMKELQRYFMLDCIMRDAFWYCDRNLISVFEINTILEEKLKLEKYIMSNVQYFLESIDLPEDIIHAPMGKYKGYDGSSKEM